MNTQSFKSRLLATSVIAGTFASLSTFLAVAQEGEEDEEARQERVVVTGSRISKRDYYANSPIDTISADSIEVAGTINVEEIINIMPQTVPGFGRTSNNPGDGTATIDLRGIGTERSLILVDGRRFVPSGTSAVDLNNIPPSLIDRVEIITGGASAVYGSDAIAGVVNIILKKDFKGVEIRNGYEATVAYGDTEFYDVGLTFGATLDDGKGNVIFDMGHVNRKAVFQGDRDFSFFALGDGRTGLIQFGSSGVPEGHSFNTFNFTALGRSTYTPPAAGSSGDGTCSAPGTSVRSPSDFNRIAFDDNTSYCGGQAIFEGTDTFRPWINSGPNNDRFNYAPFNYLQLPQERFYLTSKGFYRVNENLEVYGQVNTAFNQVPQELAPTPAFTTVETDVTNPFLSTLARSAFQQLDATEGRNAYRAAWRKVFDDSLAAFKRDPANANHALNLPPTSAANILLIAAATEQYLRDFKANPNNGAPNPAAAEYQPDGKVRVAMGRRMLENGSRVSNNDRYTFQFSSGIRGDLGDNVKFDAYFQMGQYQANFDQTGDVSLSRYQQGVNVRADSNGNPVCVDTSGGCQPINIWGRNQISSEAITYTTLTMNEKSEANLKVLVANVEGNTDGVFRLQGGPVGWAAGLEYREQDFDNRPDDNLRTGNVLGFNSSAPLRGSYDVYEVYVETSLPISRGRPWAELIELDFAVRYSDYSSAGEVEALKAGGTWSPSKDLRFRVLYNTAARAPSIFELYRSQSNGFPAATDPCTKREVEKRQEDDDLDNLQKIAINAFCELSGVPEVGVYEQRNVQIEGLFGGNPDLDPEEAETFTVGLVWQPTAIESLSLSLDYYSIEIEKYITSLAGGVGGILARCHLEVLDQNSIFCRSITRNAQGEPLVRATDVNAATLETAGYDLKVDYLFELDSVPGSIKLDYRGSYRDKYTFRAFAGAGAFDRVGTFGGNEVYAAYEHNFTVSWLNNDISLHADWSHTGGVDDPGSIVDRIDAYDYITLSARWDVNEHFRLTGGIRNALDKEPPVIGGNQEQANTYPATYDPFGRAFYVRTKFSF